MIDGDNNTLTIDNRPIAVYIGEYFPTDLSKKNLKVVRTVSYSVNFKREMKVWIIKNYFREMVLKYRLLI